MYAFVSIIYGNTNYYLEALVLGKTLNKYTKYEKYLLYSNDVPKFQLDLLKKYFILKNIKDIKIQQDNIINKKWKYVFNK